MAVYVSVVWTTGDVLTETKLDNMVSNDQSETAHSANGMIMNNNVAYRAKQAGGSTVDILKKNASDQTLIGENSVRATRFVSLTNGIEILNTGTPATSFTDIDVTANTSATTYAIMVKGSMTAGGAARNLSIRENGSTDNGLVSDILIRSIGTALQVSNQSVGVDSGQIFEYKATNGSDTVAIVLIGYWEYVD